MLIIDKAFFSILLILALISCNFCTSSCHDCPFFSQRSLNAVQEIHIWFWNLRIDLTFWDFLYPKQARQVSSLHILQSPPIRGPNSLPHRWHFHGTTFISFYTYVSFRGRGGLSAASLKARVSPPCSCDNPGPSHGGCNKRLNRAKTKFLDF